MPSRGGYHRIIVWQPSTGWAFDVGGHHALQAATPTVQEAYFQSADGGSLLAGVERTFELPSLLSTTIAHARQMRKLGCPVRMIALGFARHELWYETSRLHLEPARRGFAQFDGETVRLENDVIEAACWQVKNLLEGIPWAGTTSTDGYLKHPQDTTYEGPWWSAPAGTTVSAAGVLSATGLVSITLQLPIGGARVLPENLGLGGLVSYDRAGNFLQRTTQNQALTLDGDTWTIGMGVTSASAQPSLTVQSPGPALALRVGDLVFCNDAGDITDTGSDNRDDQISVSCPSELFLRDGNHAPALTSAATETLSEDTDGLAKFTRTIQDPGGYAFHIVSVTFESGGSEFTAAQGFRWTECPLACVVPAGGSDATTSERDIDFEIQFDFIAAATYTVTITVTDDCEETELTFDMTKS